MQNLVCKTYRMQILWFNVECPDRFKDYRDPLKLRNIFTQVKKGKAV